MAKTNVGTKTAMSRPVLMPGRMELSQAPSMIGFEKNAKRMPVCMLAKKPTTVAKKSKSAERKINSSAWVRFERESLKHVGMRISTTNLNQHARCPRLCDTGESRT